MSTAHDEEIEFQAWLKDSGWLNEKPNPEYPQTIARQAWQHLRRALEVVITERDNLQQKLAAANVSMAEVTADNAKLLELLRTSPHGRGPFDCKACGACIPELEEHKADCAFEQPHPGAAILAELQQLRDTVARMEEAAELVRQHFPLCIDCGSAGLDEYGKCPSCSHDGYTRFDEGNLALRALYSVLPAPPAETGAK